MLVPRRVGSVLAVVVVATVVVVAPVSVVSAAPAVKGGAEHQAVIDDVFAWSWGLLQDFLGAVGVDGGRGVSAEGLRVGPAASDPGPGVRPGAADGGAITADEGPESSPDG